MLCAAVACAGADAAAATCARSRTAPASSRDVHDRLHDGAILDGRQSVAHLIQPAVRLRHLAPRLRRAEARRDLDGTMEVLVARPPAAAQLHVLAIHLQ